MQLAEHSPENCIIIGIDNSEAMLKKCRANVKKIGTNKKIEIRLEDIENQVWKLSVVLMNRHSNLSHRVKKNLSRKSVHR